MPGKGHHLRSPECLPLGRPQAEAWGSREVVNVIAQNHTTRALFPPIRSGPALSRHMGFDRMAAQGRQKHANASLFSSRNASNQLLQPTIKQASK